MRIFFAFLLIGLSSFVATAQSTLPPCSAAYKNNCFGSYIDQNGNTLTGEFREGKLNGQGAAIFADGAKYEGDFIDNQYHGRGTLTRADGYKYEGEWRYDKRNGKGTLHNQGNKIVGTFIDDKLNGHGTAYLFNGDKYVGEFLDGKYHGRGRYVEIGLGTYVGELRQNKNHGQGILYSPTGSIISQGIWENDKLIRSIVLDPKRFPFGILEVSAVSQVSNPEPGKAEPDRLLADLEASRKKQQELESNLKSTFTTPAAIPIMAERRVALVVGNSRYKNNPLDNPTNDAQDMSSTLKSLGFQVIIVEDANLRKIREVTRSFEILVAKADVALIFYAGHAIESKGRNFVIPVDANLAREYELEDQAYDAQQWLAMLGETKSNNTQRVNIVILDACRNNQLSRQWRSSSNGLGRMDAPSGTLLVYSTSPGRVAADGPKGQRNSPFTKSLLQTMQLPNLPVEQVLKEVRRQVLADTNGEQVPWENSSLIGDFVFKRQR